MGADRDDFVQDAGPFLTEALTSYGDEVLNHAEVATKGTAANIGLRLLQTTAARGGERVRNRLRDAVEDAVAAPGNTDAAGAVRQAIRAAASKDPELEKELKALLPAYAGNRVTVIASGERSVAAGRDIGIAITGDGHLRKP
ncbi:hypothetical protein [Streptomyces dysideae]|nr:hypothetical protein [Streptomyces dysideae]